jgi:hypothetical protein
MSPRNSKAKQEDNLKVIVREHVLGGRTQGDVAKELRVTRETVNRNLNESGMADNIVNVAHQEIEADLKTIRADVEKHRKSNGVMPLPGVDRLLRVVELVMRLRVPDRKLIGNVDLNPEHSEEFLLFKEACAGLTEDQKHEVRAFAKGLPRTWVAPRPEENFPSPMKALEASDEAQ